MCQPLSYADFDGLKTPWTLMWVRSLWIRSRITFSKLISRSLSVTSSRWPILLPDARQVSVFYYLRFIIFYIHSKKWKDKDKNKRCHIYKRRKVYIFLCYTLYTLYICIFYTFYKRFKKIFVQIKLHCSCVSMNCVIHRIPATLPKPRFPSCAILWKCVYPDESRDAIRTRRTLQL